MKFVHLQEGLRIFRNARKLKKTGYQHYSGDYKEICWQIINECWNGRFFQTSTGNFAQFWTRDFGWCVDALLKLGYNKEVTKTLTYALRVFSKTGKTTTTITPKGKAYDFPTYSIDTLAYLFHALVVADYDITLHRPFLAKELKRFYQLAIDKETGLVRQDKHFSSMKDYALRKSSCYDNAMAASLQKDAKALGFQTPNYDYTSLLREHFWSGEYFYDDITKQEYVAGDANLFPFWLGVIQDTEMRKQALSSIEQANLDKPFPLKYTTTKTKMIWQEIFVRSYEQDSIWMHMGPLYVQVLKQVDEELALHYKQAYIQLIEKHKNVLEVFDAQGKPFCSPFYQSDAGMLWAANILVL